MAGDADGRSPESSHGFDCAMMRMGPRLRASGFDATDRMLLPGLAD